jgi:hypothetical protein
MSIVAVDKWLSAGASRGTRTKNGPTIQAHRSSKARGDYRYNQGETLADTGRSYNVSRATISRLVA